MQMFSLSHTPFSSRQCKRGCVSRGSLRGFTLVELLVSIAIIGVVTSIVLVKYRAFDSTVLLKNTAYEIALAIREAQIKSVSVVRANADNPNEGFDFPFGVTFTPNSSAYTAFKYKLALDESTPAQKEETYPKYDVADSDPDNAEKIQDISLGGTIIIDDLCVVKNGNPVPDCDVDRLDISFRRPEFKSLFYAVYSGGGDSYGDNVSKAQIKVSTSGRVNTFVVTVSSLGQISVSKE